MHKYYQKPVTSLILILMLLGGCTTGSDEVAEPAGPVTPVEDIGAVETEDCVLMPPEQPVACTMQYDPVCGCDGKTYGNACSARGAGVPRSTPGACEKDPNT